MKKMYPCLPAAFLLFSLTGCDKPATTPEGKLQRRSEVAAISMHYTQKTTSFQNWDGKSNSSVPEINRTIPIVSREKIELNIFDDGKTELFVENLATEESLFLTEATPSKKTTPEVKFYQISDGMYTVYDASKNLIFEEPMPNLSFGNILERVKKDKSIVSSFPGTITGGVIFYEPNEGTVENSGAVYRNQDNPLYSSYDDNADYEVVRTSFDEKGKSFIQEIIIKKSNKTMVWVSTYDNEFSLMSRTSFRYDDTGQTPKLRSTQDEHVELTEEGSVGHIKITEYENFDIDLNL